MGDDDITKGVQGFEKTFAEYEAYKRGYLTRMEYPKYFKGTSVKYSLSSIKIYFEDYEANLTLHLVNIYFSTPTFDKILKDESASFETKLSSIGGTLGLFTGLSILSAVEIVYFICKMAVRLLGRNLNRKPK